MSAWVFSGLCGFLNVCSERVETGGVSVTLCVPYNGLVACPWCAPAWPVCPGIVQSVYKIINSWIHSN